VSELTYISNIQNITPTQVKYQSKQTTCINNS